MKSVPQWAQKPRFHYNHDQISHAGEILRWLFARVGARNEEDEKLKVEPVREIVNFILSQDIRVYGAVYDSCIRHGETDSWNGFSEIFPNWDPWHPPTLDELFYAGKEVAKTSP